MTEPTGNQTVENLEKRLSRPLNVRERFYLIHALCVSISASGGEHDDSINAEVCNNFDSIAHLSIPGQIEVVSTLFEQYKLEKEVEQLL